MNKSVSTALGALLLCSATLTMAQAPSPGEVVMIEAARREGLTKDTRDLLAQAAALDARGEVPQAAKLYQEAVDLTARIGTNVDAERRLAIDGMTQTRLELARRAQARGDLYVAQDQVDAILKVAPANQSALFVKKDIETRLAQEAGKRPSAEAISDVMKAQANLVQANTLVQDAKLLFETKRLAEAEAKIVAALKLDPANKAAFYYRDLILNERFQNASLQRESVSKKAIIEVVEEWNEPSAGLNLPVPNPAARTNLVRTSKQRQIIYSKLNRIKLNQMEFDSLPLSEVLKWLANEAEKRDPELEGVNFMLAPNADPVPQPLPPIDPATGLPFADPFADEGTDLGGVIIKIQPPLRNLTLHQALDAIIMAADRPVKYSVMDVAVVFTPRPDETQGPQLYTRWFKIDPNTFLQGMQGVVPLSFGSGGGGQGGQGGQGGGQGGGGFGGGGGGRGGGGGGGFGGGGQGGGQGGFGQGGGQGGSEYVGVSMAGSQQFGQGGGVGGGGFGGQGGALGGAGGAGGQGGLGQQQGQGISFLTVVTPTEQLIQTVRQFFITAGLDLDPATAPGKSLYFNDRLGMLMVHATLQDLDVIEEALQVLNMAPPQITIESKFAEISQDDTRALGFDWLWGNTLLGGGKLGVQGGTAPSFGFDPANPGSFPAGSRANPTGIFPGPNGGPGLLGPGANDNRLTSGLRQTGSELFTLTGILTDPQFRVIVRALDQREGVDLLSAPKITTLSSRQAQIKVVDVRYIVIDLDLSQTASGGGGGNVAQAGVGAGGGVVGSTLQPLTQPFELGPVLDVIPYVAADGYTVQMTIIPTLKEFVGYDLDSASLFQAQAQSVGTAAANPLTTTTPLPIFRLRQVVTSAIVWDGQTVVLGGLISENVTKMKDKVPFLGDLPIVGRFFRSESNMTQKKNLVIFVTPTIIDPAGNRMHSEEELPFARTAIPPQETVPVK